MKSLSFYNGGKLCLNSHKKRYLHLVFNNILNKIVFSEQYLYEEKKTSMFIPPIISILKLKSNYI